VSPPTLAKSARVGHPSFLYGNRKNNSGRVGHPPSIGGRLGGIIDQIIPTAAGPVRVYARVVADGETAVVDDLAVYPAASDGGLEVGYTQMSQGLRGLVSELGKRGFKQVSIEAYRSIGSGVAKGTGRMMRLTVRIK